jgi:hypothetical protein
MRPYQGPAPRVPSTGKPKFVMVGIDRPGGGVRLYASREIPERELRWGLATGQYGDATGWHIDAEMRHTLIVDGATWGQAFGRVFEIWENHDRNNAIEEAQREHRQALEDGLFHFGTDDSRHKGTPHDCPLCESPGTRLSREVAADIAAGVRYELPMRGGIED